jgi:RNA polymerase primary sigma factor
MTGHRRHNKQSGEAMKPDWVRGIVPRGKHSQRLLGRLQEHHPWVRREAIRLSEAFGASCVEDDLVQEGLMGIVQADQRYEIERGVKFLTYAIWWIRHFQVRWLKEHFANVRIPDGKFERVKFGYVRLDQPVGEESSDTLMDIVPAPNGCPRHEAEDNDAIRVLRESLCELSCKQFEAVKLVYLDGKTFKQAGEVTGMSHQGVQSHAKKAFEKLRKKPALREVVGL